MICFNSSTGLSSLCDGTIISLRAPSPLQQFEVGKVQVLQYILEEERTHLGHLLVPKPPIQAKFQLPRCHRFVHSNRN